MLGSWAQSRRFDEERPAKTWTELVGRKNEEYQVADKATAAFGAASAGIASFWSSITAPKEEEQAAAQQQQPQW